MPTPPPLQLATAAYLPGESGAWSLQLAWNPTQPSSAAFWVQMQLFDGQDLANPVGNPVSTTAPNLPGGAWSATAAGATLDPATVYWISVRAGNAAANPTQVGPWSPPLPVIYLGGPKLGGVHCDGAVMELVWMPPAGASLFGTYTAFVLDAAGVALAALDAGGLGNPAQDPPGGMHQRFDLTTASLRLARAPLTVALAPTWRDPATGAVSYGPADSAALFTLPPLVSNAVYAGGTLGQDLSYTITVMNRGFAGEAAPTFEAVVEADGIPVYQTQVTTTSSQGGEPVGTLTFPLRIPYFTGLAGTPGGMVLTLALARLQDISVGPFGPKLPLPLDPPMVVSAECTPGEGGGVALALEYPPGAPLAGAARVNVWGAGGGLAITGNFRGSRGMFGTADHLEPGEAYTLSVHTLAGQSVGPPSPAIPLVTVAPAITTVSFDGRVARVGWVALDSVVPGLSGYRVSVTSGGPEVVGVTVNDTAAALEVPAGGESLAVEVRALAGVVRGPASLSIPLVAAAPGSAVATTDPVTGVTTLAWTPVEGATGYSLQFYADGAPYGEAVSVAEAGYVLPQPLVPNANEEVEGAVVTTSGGATVTGPYSPPYPLPTAQPTGVSASYDGAMVTVGWTDAAGATGYVVSLLQEGAAAPLQQAQAGPGATGAEMAFVIQDFTKTYGVVVQALVGASSGPPTEEVALFRDGWAVSTALSTEQAPSVFPVTIRAAGAWDLVAYLPDVCAGQGLDGTPSQGAFTLSANDDTATRDAYPYKLTIPADSEAWTLGTEPVRTQLQADYVNFLKAAEHARVVPWGISLLQETISRVMPQTFQETLFYAYGLDLAAGTADLRPGMVLRVALAGWETVPGTPAPAYLSGYAAGGVVEYEVGSYAGGAGWAVGLDAFVARLVAGGALQVSAPASSVPQQQAAGVADAADLFFPGFLQPFYRLFVPSPLASPSEVGNAYTPDNFVLAASGTYTALTTAVPYPTSGGAVAYFRGRAVLKPCIRVWVNGTAQVVPIGTTLGNVLDGAAARVPAGAVLPRGLSVLRGAGQVVLDPSAGWPAGRALPLWLGGGTGSLPVYGPGADALSLPLLHGDRVTLPG